MRLKFKIKIKNENIEKNFLIDFPIILYIFIGSLINNKNRYFLFKNLFVIINKKKENQH